MAVFGARALWEEKRTGERQLRDQLDRDADVLIHGFADRLERLQSIVNDDLQPEKSLRGFPNDASWVYVERRSDKLQVYPPNSLPYELGASYEMVQTDPDLSRIERLESQESPELVIAAYRDLLPKARPAMTPEIQHRLARLLNKVGRASEAVRLWRRVESSGGRIGSLPADLVAGFELTAIDEGAAKAFLRNLTEGRWRLEKARYLYYSAEIHKRVGENNEADIRLRLAEAVEAALSSSSRVFRSEGEVYTAFRSETPFAVLIASSKFLETHVWPQVFSTANSDVRIVHISANGDVLYSVPRDGAGPASARTFNAAGLSWNIAVEPKDAAGFYAAMNRRTNFYLGMLSLVVLSLLSGGYFIARTVRRELEVARMKSEFVSTVSHEFRSPLTGIRQLGEMLARDRITDESKRHQYYELIVRESERLARLVENILDFSRMDAGGKQYQFEPLDTAAWLRSVAEDFQVEASRSGHLLQAEIPKDLPAISGDREALSTALRNLLDNACKYSPTSKDVWLDAEAANGGVRVRVRDHGIGIPAREQRQIFEKFYRGGALAGEVKGAGLGLSLVQHIVSAHEGEVHVESREGEGSTFSLCLRGSQ